MAQVAIFAFDPVRPSDLCNCGHFVTQHKPGEHTGRCKAAGCGCDAFRPDRRTARRRIERFEKWKGRRRERNNVAAADEAARFARLTDATRKRIKRAERKMEQRRYASEESE